MIKVRFWLLSTIEKTGRNAGPPIVKSEKQRQEILGANG